MEDLLFLVSASCSALLALLGLFAWALLLCRWGSPVFAADWETLERALGQGLERRSVPALPRSDPALNWRHFEVDMPTQGVSDADDWDDVVVVRKKKKRLKAHRKNPNYAVLPGLQDDVFTEDIRTTEMETVEEDEEDEEEEEEKEPVVKMKKKKLRLHPKSSQVSDEGEEGVVVKKKKKKLRVHPKNPQYETLKGVNNDIFGEDEEADVVVKKKKKKKLRVHPKNPQYDTLRGVKDDIFAEGGVLNAVIVKKKKKLRVHPKNPQYDTLRGVQDNIFTEERDGRSASRGTTLLTHTTEATRGTNRTNVYPSDDDDED